MNGAVTLSIGQELHLRRGKDRILYAGMPSEDVYSIVQKKQQTMYQGFAWNLYFPRTKSNITIDGVSIHVENATPDEIRLRVG